MKASGGSDAPVLACANLHRYLGEGPSRVHALRGVSLSVEAGAVCAVVGPSGCGKSTLLYALGLLDRPDSGEIRILGEELSGADDAVRTRFRNRRIGFVFQFHFLLAEFTALENVMLPMYKRPEGTRSEIRDRAASLLAEVGLREKGDRLATRLSGGERQRVAIARALANSGVPGLLLADEPTGNLDAANAHRVLDLLIRLAGEKNHAVVLATHNPEIAARCHAVVSMQDGVIVS